MTVAATLKESRADDARNRVWIFGYPVSHSVAPKLFDVLFPALGLPNHNYSTSDCKTLDEPNASWFTMMKQPYALGSCLTMPLKLEAMNHCDILTDTAKIVGSVNTTYLQETSDGKVLHVGTNLDTLGVKNSLLTVLSRTASPFPHLTPTSFVPASVSGFCIGGGGAARAVVFALNSLGVENIYLINRDRAETDAIRTQFPNQKLITLETVKDAEAVLADNSKPPIALGVGAIPCISPKTKDEENVYEISRLIFSSKYRPQKHTASGKSIPLPEKRVFLEMAYKPPMTIMRQVAEDTGWHTISGIEVVLEGCFEQAILWTGKTPTLENREEARRVLRD